jgi:hypothetical protein
MLYNIFLLVISLLMCNFLLKIFKSFKHYNLFYITGVCTLHVLTNIGHLQVSKIADKIVLLSAS